jgi:hypothetical protein
MGAIEATREMMKLRRWGEMGVMGNFWLRVSGGRYQLRYGRFKS